jgi:hypothetical protein
MKKKTAPKSAAQKPAKKTGTAKKKNSKKASKKSARKAAPKTVKATKRGQDRDDSKSKAETIKFPSTTQRKLEPLLAKLTPEKREKILQLLKQHGPKAASLSISLLLTRVKSKKTRSILESISKSLSK